jgi:hypothetical protein
MAITYPLALPTVTGIAQITLTARNSVAVTSSPFTFKQQILQHQGSRWEATITLPPMQRANAETWISFLISLYGQYGTFLLGDPIGATARGSAATTPGTPLVNGASQTGNTLNIDGAPNSATGYLKAGDYIQLGSASTSQLYKVLADANSNGSGEVSVDIWPALRSSPTDNSTVVVSSAKGLFRLTTPESSFSIDTASFYGLAFAAVESL